MTALKAETPPKDKMTFDEFMTWYETAEGRWELHNGVPVRKHDPTKGQAERARHARAKHRVVQTLSEAIAKAGLDCEALPDGMTVRVSDEIAYEPDALVYCGERIADEAIVVPDPVIIVEVLSPSTAYKDLTDKLADYFSLPSLAHYLVIDPVHGQITHHYRAGKEIAARIIPPKTAETLTLDPPGLTLALDMLAT